MITVYENGGNLDGLGIGTLAPTAATVEEIAGGLYELTVTQPADEQQRQQLLTIGRIIRCPAPAREAPEATYGGYGQTITREVWRCTVNTYLYIRKSPNGEKLGAMKPGDRAMLLNQDTSTGSTWFKIQTLNTGIAGYVFPNINGSTPYMVRDGSITITIGDDSQVISGSHLTREQLFRIYETEVDSAAHTITARARHITYDLMGSVITNLTLQVSDTISACCSRLTNTGYVDHNAGIRITNYITGNIKIKMGARNALDILLNQTDGILTITKGRLIRDNYDIYLIPEDDQRIRERAQRGRNMIKGIIRKDGTFSYNRILPVGKDAGGAALKGSIQGTGEQPYITRIITYDIQAAGTSDAQIAAAKNALNQAARAALAAGQGRPRLEAELDLADINAKSSVHLYDWIQIYDPEMEIRILGQMTGYVFDVLAGRYTHIDLDKLEEIT